MTIKQLPFQTQLIDPVKFDVSIYPVSALLTTNGVQYETAITNQTTSYVDLFSIDTDTYFPAVKGKLAWVYVNLSFEIKAGNGTPTATYKAEFKKAKSSSWTIMSAEETYVSVTESYVGVRLEGYIDIDTVDEAPFDIRVQFKSNGTAAGDKLYAILKNDTVIRLVGSRETR